MSGAGRAAAPAPGSAVPPADPPRPDLPRSDPMPGPMPALAMVATDLDGTLLDADGTLSPRTRAALAAARERGVQVVAVTGRPPRWVLPLAGALAGGLAVCANGAVVLDTTSGQVVRSRALAPADVAEIAALLLAAVPGSSVALETLRGLRGTPGWEPRPGAPALVVADLEELLADDPGVVKVLLRVPGRTCDEVLAVARSTVAHLGEPTHSGAREGLVEISARGVSKAATLADLAAERGVGPEGVAAFGDMPNDLPMLAWAGAAWAMANAHADVLALAERVAPAHTEDGVAQVLEALLARG